MTDTKKNDTLKYVRTTHICGPEIIEKKYLKRNGSKKLTPMYVDMKLSVLNMSLSLYASHAVAFPVFVLR